jgi:hypothetical protein
MPAMALSRVSARVVESGPDGQDLAAGAWQRLEALPDPRSPAGANLPAGLPDRDRSLRVHRCRNDRFTAVGQWMRWAGQADLARLRAPWDPIVGRY